MAGPASKRFTAHERTGRALGDEGFIDRIESASGRPDKWKKAENKTTAGELKVGG